MIWIVVIGVLMNLIVFMLYFRLEKLSKCNNVNNEQVPHKSILNDYTYTDGLASLHFKDITEYISIEEMNDDGLNDKCGFHDFASCTDEVIQTYPSPFKHKVDSKRNTTPLYDYRMATVDKKDVYRLYFELSKN